MRRPTRLLLLSLSAATAAPLPEPQEPRVWTVFCAECTNNFDYKSIGVYWSHRLSGMPGGVTRLLACDEEQLKRYKGLNLGNTFVHRNYGRIQHKRRVPEGETHPPTGSRAQDSSPSYNKPGSIMEWVMHSEEAKSTDYVLYIDADMLLRKPLDPIAMGVKKGVVVSEHVGYLDTGIRNGLPAQFLPSVEAVQYAGADVNNYNPPGPDGKRHAAGGWYMFFHIDDIRTIAPRWLHYEIEVRTNPQKYWSIRDEHSGQLSVPADILTGDAYVGHGSAPWISEMYGYVFAAAEAKLRHILTEGVVVYPDEVGAARPKESFIIHYGLHCAVGSFKFTKYSFGGFDANACSGKTFGDPPAPRHIERLCAETVLELNDAMCDYYNRPVGEGGCGRAGSEGLPTDAVTCPAWKTAGQQSCADQNQMCLKWAASGECKSNPGFMEGTCPVSCDVCPPAATNDIPAWVRGLALANGTAPPPLRPMGEIKLFYSDADQAAAAHEAHYKEHPHARAADEHAAAAAEKRLSHIAAAKLAPPAAELPAATAAAAATPPPTPLLAAAGTPTTTTPHPMAADIVTAGVVNASNVDDALAEATRLRALAAKLEEEHLVTHPELRRGVRPATAPKLSGGELEQLERKREAKREGKRKAASPAAAPFTGAEQSSTAAAAPDGRIETPREPEPDPLSMLRGVFGAGWGMMLGLCACVLYRRLCRSSKRRPAWAGKSSHSRV